METQKTLSDEISLLDIAKTLVIRRNWFFALFLTAMLVTLAFTYSKRSKSEVNTVQLVHYTTFLSIGWLSSPVLIEPMNTVETLFREIYLKERPSKIPVEIVQDSLKMGNIMKIVSTVPVSLDSVEYSKEVANYHLSIIKPLLIRHEKLFKDIVAQNQLNKSVIYTTHSEILSLAQKSNSAESVALSSNSNITSGRTLIFGILFSFVFGLVGVFVLEFILQVKKSLDQDLKEQ